MSEPTREEKLRTIKAARNLSKRMWEEQLGPALKEFVEMQRLQRELMLPHVKPRQVEPQEDPAEQQRLHELLDSVTNQNKETK